MIKINYFFVITTAQLLSENEVPKFTGAEVKIFLLRIWFAFAEVHVRKILVVADDFIGNVHDWLDEKRQVRY